MASVPRIDLGRHNLEPLGHLTFDVIVRNSTTYLGVRVAKGKSWFEVGLLRRSGQTGLTANLSTEVKEAERRYASSQEEVNQDSSGLCAS